MVARTDTRQSASLAPGGGHSQCASGWFLRGFELMKKQGVGSMSDSTKGKYDDFACRVRWALDQMGIESSATSRARAVADMVGVSIPTALKYIMGKSQPKTLDRMGDLADGLGLFVGWLACGGENVPRTNRELEIVRNISEMTSHDRAKMLRAMIRYNSGSRKAKHYFRLLNEGKITARIVLDVVGAPSVSSINHL